MKDIVAIAIPTTAWLLPVLLLAAFLVAVLLPRLRRRGAVAAPRRDRSTPAAARRPGASVKSPHAELEEKIRALGGRFWRSRELLEEGTFRLNPQTMPWSSYEAAAKRLLQHARKVAPGVGFQSLVPQVVVTDTPGAGGNFQVDGEGHVHIELHARYSRNRELAHAILAHEISHYVLAANGLSRKDRDEDERLTEVAVFVLGFGDLYLRGGTVFRAQFGDHRLGYLSDAEYRFLYDRSEELRRTNGLGLPTELEILKQELRAMVFSKGARESLVEHARRDFPHYREVEIYRYVIERLRRDLR